MQKLKRVNSVMKLQAAGRFHRDIENIFYEYLHRMSLGLLVTGPSAFRFLFSCANTLIQCALIIYVSHGIKRNVENVQSCSLKFTSVSRSFCYYFLTNQIKSLQSINIKSMYIHKQRSPLFNMPLLQNHEDNISFQFLYFNFLKYWMKIVKRVT